MHSTCTYKLYVHVYAYMYIYRLYVHVYAYMYIYKHHEYIIYVCNHSHYDEGNGYIVQMDGIV